MSKLRLLNVNHQYRPAIGGAEEYVAGIAEELARRGHFVSVYTANSTDYESWTGNLPQEEEIAGVYVRRFRAIPRRHLTWKLLRFGLWRYLETPRVYYEPLILIGNGPLCPGMFIKLATSWRAFDIVHLNSLHYAHTAYGYVAARMAGLPVVITPNVHVEQRETWDVGYMRAILARADLIFAQSEYERQFHISQGRHPDWVVTGGVGLKPEAYTFPDRDTARQWLGIPVDAPVILHIGRQVAYKGMDRVLAAAQRLNGRYRQLVVLLVGPESEWGRDVLSRYTGAPWLRCLGHVDSETKLAALAAADVMVMPSHGESLGITYLESWLAGRPVIGLAKGAVQTLIEHGKDGFLVPPDDDQALVEAIQAVLDNPDNARAMGCRGREKVLSRYTLSRIADIFEQACHRLLEAKRVGYAR